MEKENIYNLIYQLFELSPIYNKSANHTQIYSKYNITHQEYFCLFILRKHPKNMGEISKEHGVSPQQLSRLCESLESKELITRSVDKENRRKINSEITQKGKDLLENIKKDIFSSMCSYFDDLTEDDISIATNSLKVVNEVFKKVNLKK